MALDFVTTEDPNSVENIFCKLMEKSKVQPMDEHMTKILISMILDSQLADQIHKEASSKSINISILEDRLRSMGKEIDKGAAIMVWLACETPGQAVMYSYYISYMMKQRQLGKAIDLQTLCSEVFPLGFFTQESLQSLWDEQKVKRERGSDNLLDYTQASKSLVFEIQG